MAIRYSGQVRISCVYRDQGDYRCMVSSPGGREILHVNPPASGFGSGVSYDSPKAYDRTAHAALSFARESLTDEAATTDSGWHVGRTKATAWGSGPNTARSPNRRPRTKRPLPGDSSSHGRKASEFTDRGRKAEMAGYFSSAAVWYRKAAVEWKKAGSPTRARLWAARAKDIKTGGRQMGTLYRGGATHSMKKYGRSRTRTRR